MIIYNVCTMSRNMLNIDKSAWNLTTSVRDENKPKQNSYRPCRFYDIQGMHILLNIGTQGPNPF